MLPSVPDWPHRTTRRESMLEIQERYYIQNSSWRLEAYRKLCTMQMTRILTGASYAYLSSTKVCVPKRTWKTMPSTYRRSRIQQINTGTRLNLLVITLWTKRSKNVLTGRYRRIQDKELLQRPDYQAGVDEQLVIDKAGHRSVEGVRNYKHTSEHQPQHLSDILTGSHGAVTPTNTDLNMYTG